MQRTVYGMAWCVGVWSERGLVVKGKLPARRECTCTRVRARNKRRGGRLALLPNARTMILPVVAGKDIAASLACGVCGVRVVVVVARQMGCIKTHGRARSKETRSMQAVVLRVEALCPWPRALSHASKPPNTIMES